MPGGIFYVNKGKMKKDKQLIYSLLAKFFNVESLRDDSDDTILHLMSIFGYDQLVESMLSSAGHLAFIANNLGRYPIHAAVLNGQHDCVKLLIAVDKVEQLTDSKGRNALHYAARCGDSEMLKICLSAAIPKNSVDMRNQSPLILATIVHNTVAVKELLAACVEINQVDDIHSSALHYAVLSNDIDIVSLLLNSSDIDVNISDNYARNPLDLLKLDTSIGAEIAVLLAKKGAVHAKADGL